jgi:hypothetical protein
LNLKSSKSIGQLKKNGGAQHILLTVIKSVQFSKILKKAHSEQCLLFAPCPAAQFEPWCTEIIWMNTGGPRREPVCFATALFSFS